MIELKARPTNNSNKADLISLAQAADHCDYSQEYLSLRARQGKLRAIKRGRNWFTTLGWLDDYLQQVDDIKTQLKTTVAIPVAIHHLASSQNDLAYLVDQAAAAPAVKATGQQFFWEHQEEEADLAPAHDAVIHRLQQKVDQILAREGATPIAIDTANSDPVSITEERPSFAELGLAEAMTEEPSVTLRLQPIMRPTLIMAVVILLFSSLIIFNKPYRITQSIAVGAGVTLYEVGQRLIEVGENQELASAARLANRGGLLQASELKSSTAGRVAGATTDQADLSTNPVIRFWQIMEIGLDTVLD